MERYQQPMVNILTRKAPPQQVRRSNDASSKALRKAYSAITPAVSTTLTCPAGTPQDPSYLTIPFTAPSGEPLSAKEPKRPKEQDASMFIACSDTQLVIGMDVTKQLSTVISVVHWLLMHLTVLIANICVFSQAVMEGLHSACRRIWRVDSQSLVTHLRAAHSARVTSRSKPWKCGASRTLFPFVTVFAHNKTQAINFYSTGNHKSTLYFLNVIKNTMISMEIFKYSSTLWNAMYVHNCE